MNILTLEQKTRRLKMKSFETMQRILKDSGLTKTEFEILRCIYVSERKNKMVNASLLADYFEISIPAVMHKLESLENKTMLSRRVDEKDKRNKYYELTTMARKKCKELDLKRQSQLENFLAFLGEDVVHLEKILDLSIEFMEVENV